LERPTRIWLLLAPALALIVLLFGGGLLFGLLQSLGYLPFVGQNEPGFTAYRNVFASRGFWAALWLTLYIATAATLISTVLALGIALLLRPTFVGKGIMSFLVQLNLPIPHLVGAIAVVQLFGQSGLFARVAYAFGWIDDPGQFPALVFDRWGIGIIAEYVWKETPFIAVTLLALLSRIGDEYEQVAQTLGASRWQRFRRVLLPLLMPGILSSSIIVFAYSFSAFEVPLLLGVTYPQTLPVLAYKSYTDVDLQSRPEAMALSMIIAAIIIALTYGYVRLAREIRN
jgi:putative spermidine/putrescine transport system permease protein